MDTDDVTRHLKKAISAIENAKGVLFGAPEKVSEDDDVVHAISLLEGAQSDIKRAIRELD